MIATTLFLFLTYGLYKRARLVNNYPKFENYQPKTIIHEVGVPGLGMDIGDDIGGIVLSILSWIAMAILMVILLLVFESLFWLSLFVIFAFLYWIFIRVLNLFLTNPQKPEEIWHHRFIMLSCTRYYIQDGYLELHW